MSTNIDEIMMLKNIKMILLDLIDTVVDVHNYLF